MKNVYDYFNPDMVQRYRLASLEMTIKTARLAIDPLPDKKQNLKV
jgi:hypothetical protein